MADEILQAELAGSPLSGPDRALVTELFYGCLRQHLALEYVLGQLAGKPPRTVVANILHLGLYQLLFLERIPPHAAVHESVELAKRKASVNEAKFVNAVLRRASQEPPSLAVLRESRPWVFYSHPQWLWERWLKRWGPDSTNALCDWDNQPPSVYLRLNTLKTSKLSSEIIAEPTAHPLSWRVADASALFQTRAWNNGEFYVQDPSTLLSVDTLDPQPGEQVLDMCAAPGGKTTYIAAKMQNRGQIIAADSANVRLGKVSENCQRLGVSIVATLPCEGTRLTRCLRGSLFDRILLDAPCSNTGVLRRRVDLRWRIQEAEIARLAELQVKLLTVAVELIKPGGVIVYSTCSLEAEENERVVEKFCATVRGFEVESQQASFPPRDAVDGAFVAKLRKKQTA